MDVGEAVGGLIVLGVAAHVADHVFHPRRAPPRRRPVRRRVKR